MARILRPDLNVRQVALDHPATREVFRRYGEEADRVVFGHLEPIERFARRRGVDLQALLQELASAGNLSLDPRAASHERLHRPFVVAALFLALTLGTAWGAYLLYRIGWQGSFAAVSPAQVVAHGAAQLWGFVAVFIVGISFRYLFTATQNPPPSPAARRFALSALLLGVLSGFAWSVAPHSLAFLGSLSGLALLAGSCTYFLCVKSLLSGRLGEVWARSVLVSAGWTCIWAVWTLVLQTRYRDSGPSAYSLTDRQLVMDLALFGLAVGSVYGFGQKLLPGLLSVGRVRREWFAVTFWLHQLGLAHLLLGRWFGATLAIISGLWVLSCGTLAYGVALRGLRSRSVPTSPIKGHRLLPRYIQLAYGWLCLSVLGFAVIEMARGVWQVEIPHAVVGALRHALTVGFLVTLILGVGQRLLPILGHTLPAWPKLVPPIFLLIGLGNLSRVATEAAVPWWPGAFRIMPFSSLLELAALLLFTASALRTMWPVPEPLLIDGKVGPATRVAPLLAEHPWIEDRLIELGADSLRQMRQVPETLSLAALAAFDRLPPSEVVESLNRAIHRSRSKPTQC